jgi:telomerase Cajal body protein 1
MVSPEEQKTSGTEIRWPNIELVAQSGESDLTEAAQNRNFFYTNAQWTPDGTAMVSLRSDKMVSVFVLPHSLLEPQPHPYSLEHQSSIKLPEPTQAVAIAPYFSLQDPTSQLLLVAPKDHPIQMYHAFPADSPIPAPISTYKLIRSETEAYLTPSSLLWFSPGSQFITGALNRLSLFDVSRPANWGAVATILTMPNRRSKAIGTGVGMRGHVASLAFQHPDKSGLSLIAAGTRTRWIGLYDILHMGDATANWSIANVAEREFGAEIGGKGIVQTVWSPCGRYLIINERDSSGLLVYDVRGTGRPLSVLLGRCSSTPQRLSCDVFQGTGGSGTFEVWAGTQDGKVLVWENVGGHGGLQDPSWHWQAHESPVGSTIIHPSGSVVATCSGSWVEPRDDELEREAGGRDGIGRLSLSRTRFSADRTLKVWSVGSNLSSDSLEDHQNQDFHLQSGL